MKKYNVPNYVRYKKEVEKILEKSPDIINGDYTPLDNEQMANKFLLLVFNLTHKQSTSQQASGVMSINDLIQEGNKGLILAVDKLDWAMIDESPDVEKTLKSFFSKRIKGAIRRAIDINRGDIRIPEHKLNEIRKNPKDQKIVAMFFNSVFSSIDENFNNEEEDPIYQIADKSEPYNIQILNIYLKGLMKKYLTPIEYEVLRLSYGLDCEKHSANYIANKLNINVSTANVRVSQIKREAIDRLIANTDANQVIDYL